MPQKKQLTKKASANQITGYSFKSETVQSERPTVKEANIDKINLRQLEFRIQDKAYWNIFKKYFGVLCATILAIILAKPDLAKSITLGRLTLSTIIYYYFIVGVIGLVVHEYFIAGKELFGIKDNEYPILIRKVVFLYLVGGICICFTLLKSILS
jgi:hypothetical protein